MNNTIIWLGNADSSFVPPLVYAMMGSSRDLAVGTVAVASLLISSMLGREVSPTENPKLFVQLALTATFFAGVFQASLGLLRSVSSSTILSKKSPSQFNLPEFYLVQSQAWLHSGLSISCNHSRFHGWSRHSRLPSATQRNPWASSLHSCHWSCVSYALRF